MCFESRIQMKNLKQMVKCGVITIACIVMMLVIIPICSYATENIRGTGTVTADSLNVRTGPGKEYEAVGKVYSGNVLEVIGMEGDWFKINYNSTEGYVSSEYMLYEPDEDLLVEDDTIDEPKEEIVSEETPDDQGMEENVSTGPEKYKIIFGLIAVIVVVLIIILITIKSIKNLDLEDEYDEDDDDVDYDEEYEDEYDDDYEEDDSDYEDDEDEYDDEDENYEYKHIVIRKPKQSTIEKGSKKDDYLIDIDPRYFE